MTASITSESNNSSAANHASGAVVGCAFPPNAQILGFRRRLYQWFPVKGSVRYQALRHLSNRK